ncbi:hypothetical protein ABZ930_31085 [Streptomyces sp. NPDC046716]|uniref:hypothetical protein n=1 Tax=Streptomyces sp. NPDC046716 TaxID=3157093 RepID=UPI0033E0C347
MKTTVITALTAVAALSFSMSMAQADDGDNNTQQFTGGGIQAADNFDHATCLCPIPGTESNLILPAPSLSDYQGGHKNNMPMAAESAE